MLTSGSSCQNNGHMRPYLWSYASYIEKLKMKEAEPTSTLRVKKQHVFVTCACI